MFHSSCLDLVSLWANAISRACVYEASIMELERACTLCPVPVDVLSPGSLEVTTGGKETFIWDHHHSLAMSLDMIQYSIGHLSESPEPSFYDSKSYFSIC